jgi:hypothetical protein
MIHAEYRGPMMLSVLFGVNVSVTPLREIPHGLVGHWPQIHVFLTFYAFPYHVTSKEPWISRIA